MENQNGDKIYDLEIISIGALYSGHWEKKYWSSSRGKDRHPYPVGYKSTRTNSGNTYMMEIHEGLRGPLFTVSTPDGVSCTGQTPDIAWDNFQKKSGPRIKNWLGKRFSTKIDGVELFGFRNPFVQRLLRELVMNGNGVAKSSLAAPSFCSRASELEHKRNIESHVHPELLPSLEKQHITGKRSMKNRSAAEVLSKEPRIKRKQSHNNAVFNDSKSRNAVCTFIKDTSAANFQEEHVSSFNDVVTVQVTSSPHTNSFGGSSLQVNIPNVVGESYHSLLPLEEVLKESKHYESPVRKNMIFNEQNSHVDKIQLEKKSFDTELEQRDPLTLANNNDGELVDLVYKNISVIDTCDIDEDRIVGCILKRYKASLCSTKDELPVAKRAPKSSVPCPSRILVRSLPEELANNSNHNVSKHARLSEEVKVTCTPADHLPRGVIHDSFPEAGSSSSSSNPSSENVDLDLAGQELARSMMTFLLPRAVPLLTKTKRRSKRRCRANKHEPCSTLVVPTHGEQVERELLTDRISQGDIVAKVTVKGSDVHIQEKMNALPTLQGADSLCQLNRTEPLSEGCMASEPFTQNGSSNNIKFVIPDSFEDYQCALDVASKRHPPSFCEDSSGDEILRHEIMPRQGLSTGDKAEYSFQRSSCPYNNLADEVAKTSSLQSHMICSAKNGDSYSPNCQINLNVQSATDSKNTNTEIQVGACDISHVRHGKEADSLVNKDSSSQCKTNVLSSGELLPDSHKVAKIPQTCISSQKHPAPLSEIIICRNYEDCDCSERHFHQNVPSVHANDQARNIGSDADITTLVANEVMNLKTNKELLHLITVKNVPASLHEPVSSAPDASRNHNIAKTVIGDIKSSNFIDPSFSGFIECVNPLTDVGLLGESCKQYEKQNSALESFPFPDIDPPVQPTTDHDHRGCYHSQVLQKSHLDDSSSFREKSTLGMRDSMEFCARYLHPNPVLSISLASKEDSLKICVLCGLVDSNIRSIFMYIIPVQEYTGNCPSFLGYTLLTVPLSKDPHYRDIPFERSGLQLIPDKQCLVFFSSIKAPRCREQRIDCPCTNCKADYSEENVVEIVHVNFGYVSTRIKLVTAERVSSVLACQPNYLIAAEQNGRLHVWIMNPEWSVNLEEFMLPKFDEMSPVILELKQIPNCSSLIIGHNGLGGFAIWNISQRVLLAKISSPGITTFQILPVGLFKCTSEDSLKTCMEMEHIEETTLMIEKDIAVWLLVSADSGTDVQCQTEKPNEIPVGCWRLGLLVRNTLILGSILDPRASAASTSLHCGIYGTCDGFLYKWKLSSGENLASLHPFKCESVSNIATDAQSGAVAVAGDGGQLLVYFQPRVYKSEAL